MCGGLLRWMSGIRSDRAFRRDLPEVKRRHSTRSIGKVPSAAQRSGPRALLVFDGDCGFCTSAVGWLERALPSSPKAVPYQWADLDDLGLTTEEAAERVWLLTTDSKGESHQYGGHLAVAAMLRRQPLLSWRFLGVLLGTAPFSWLAGAGYALVARYRYLLPGGTPACRVGRGS